MSNKKAPNSAVVIAELLDAEGFSAFTAQQIKRYMLRCDRVAGSRERRHQRVKKAFGVMVKEKLDTADRLVLGKYISHLAAIYFNAGLKAGLAASVAVDKGDSGEPDVGAEDVLQYLVDALADCPMTTAANLAWKKAADYLEKTNG